MVSALSRDQHVALSEVVAVGTHRSIELPSEIDWISASHPLPDEQSLEAGSRAWEMASRTEPDAVLLLLLSGGASSLLALPSEGISLDDKRTAIDRAMRGGADIHQLNALRKHLSRIKGGQLAAACRGMTLTLAISDVVGDDLSVIASGPGVADPSTWDDVAKAFASRATVEFPASVASRIADGVAGRLDETPKPGDPRLARTVSRVIAGRGDLLRGARAAAESLGYQVIAIPEPVTGEAREAAQAWYQRVRAVADGRRDPVCVISAGETTVQVRGTGRGGRNQEFALSLVENLAASSTPVVLASVGTDGIDGPTDAAGAYASVNTLDRARQLGLSPSKFLDNNDAFKFFEPLDDLIRVGRTDTNVGDLQIYLSAGT